jgi:hypothetical protein
MGGAAGRGPGMVGCWRDTLRVRPRGGEAGCWAVQAIRDERAERVWALITERVQGGVAAAEDVCAAVVPVVGVSGATVGVFGQGAADRRALVCATDEVGRRLDDWQFTFGEGPCVEAWTLGGMVLVADLSSSDSCRRWPMFAPAAVTAGAQALFAFPLQVGAIRIGTLDLHRAQAGPLSDEQLADALAFASAAVAVLLSAAGSAPNGTRTRTRTRNGTRNGTGAGDGGGWPFDGLGEGRVEVYQATGMVAGQLRIGLAEALVRLRGYAFAHGMPVSEVAALVVNRALRLPSHTGDG